MAKLLWEPGKAVYAEWLKTLTPEEYNQHLAERKINKSLKQAMNETIQAQKEQWIAKINNAMVSVIEKAERDGDPAALVAVYDRLIGKPDNNVDITSNGKTLQAPTIIFQATELSEWTDREE